MDGKGNHNSGKTDQRHTLAKLDKSAHPALGQMLKQGESHQEHQPDIPGCLVFMKDQHQGDEGQNG